MIKNKNVKFVKCLICKCVFVIGLGWWLMELWESLNNYFFFFVYKSLGKLIRVVCDWFLVVIN